MKIAPRHALALLLAGVSLARAQDGATRVIAIANPGTGVGATPAPGLSGNFTGLGDLILNGSGVVAFAGYSGAGEAIYESIGTGLLTIASSFQAAPAGGGNFSGFQTFALNESGTVAFSGQTLGGSAAIYTGAGGSLTTVAATGQAAPGLGANITISGFSANLAFSDTGTVAFRADASTGSAEYFGAGGVLTAAATTLQTAPGTGALFSSLMPPTLNNSGTAAFVEQNGSAYGIYTAFGSTLTTVATTQQTAPELNATFFAFGFNPSINDSGSVAFFAFTGTGSGRGVFARLGGVLTAIATTARQAPGFSGNFKTFLEPAISNSGSVVFRGQETGGGFGIYTGTGGPTLQTIALTGQAAPGVGGVFSSFGKPAINDLGTVAFLANSGTGLYLADGQQLVTVAYAGQSISGSTISSISFAGGTDRGGSSQLNNNGQFAYKAALANGTTSIQLFTPTLHIRSGVSGAWATRSGWTLGLLPASVHDVVIDPAAALTITGPMLPTTVRSLAINGSGANVSELTLQSTGTINATAGGASTGVSGRLGGSGKIIANLTSAGTIAPGTGSATGAISITGNVTLQSTAHLAFDLGGLVRKTGYDFFGVSGQLTLGGALDVALMGGFSPLAGSSFDLFDAASVTGAFGSIHLPVLTGGLTWNTALLPTTGVISVAGLTVTPTTYTLAASASAATIHAGGASTITATITNTGAAGTDTLNYSGLNVSASPAGGTVTGVTLALTGSALANGNAAQSGTATFSSSTGGTYTLTPTVSSATNATLGSAATNAGATTATVTVFSGSAKWAAAGPASWGAGANWTDTAAASVHAAPGTFSGFAANDTAVFDGTSGGSAVTLNGTSPSLAALTFTGGSYTIAQGTGGTLTLNGGTSPATVTDSAGSHTISAPVQLATNATAAVTSAGSTLTFGAVTGVGKTLTKTGVGTLILSGAQNYAVLDANGGTTRLTGSFTNGTAIIHANATTKIEASQTLGALIIGDGVEVTFGNGAGAAFDEPSVKADGLAVVPEPGTAGLLLVGALGFLARRRRA